MLFQNVRMMVSPLTGDEQGAGTPPRSLQGTTWRLAVETECEEREEVLSRVGRAALPEIRAGNKSRLLRWCRSDTVHVVRYLSL
jgi:hypothetical protein